MKVQPETTRFPPTVTAAPPQVPNDSVDLLLTVARILNNDNIIRAAHIAISNQAEGGEGARTESETASC